MNSAQSLAEQSQERHRFDHRDMDYYFSWILRRQAFGGSDVHECFEVAEPISSYSTA